MKIGQIASEAGVTVDTVRFYERVGVLPEPARTESGYRDYEPGTVEREADRLQLAAHDAGGATCESERWRLDAVLARVDAKLAELTATRERILEARQACEEGCCLFTAR